MTAHTRGAPSGLVEALAAARDPGSSLADIAELWWTRTASADPVVRAMLSEPDRLVRVRREAAVLEQRYADPDDRPPLYGAALAVKDIFHVDGFLTRAGSRLPPELLTGEQGPAVTRSIEAGALVLGKSVTTEFAYFDPGPTRNPRDINRTPGGSSSGSAAAVAAGFCHFALGSQTAGSVIRPAAFCGVVGTKPSFGRVGVEGTIALAPSFDTVGWFTPRVADAHVVASILVDGWRPVADARPPRLGVPEGAYLAQADPRALEAFEHQLSYLAGRGFDVARVAALDDVEEVNARHVALMRYEAARVHDAWFGRYRELYGPALTVLITEGRKVTDREAACIADGRGHLRSSLEATMDAHGIDAWVCPAAPGIAPLGRRSTGSPAMNIAWTHAGMPAVTIPSGTLDSMPLGLQVVGRFGGDEHLLAWSARIEDALRAAPAG